MATLEFFYDCSSPWTYLAFDRIETLASEAGATLVWKPILVGGVFNTVNPSVYAAREQPVEAKANYARKDLADWARYQGLKIGWPSVFPVNSVKAMRAAIVAQSQGLISPWSKAVFDAYWGQDRDISQPDVLLDLADRVGLGPDLLERIASKEIKAKLRSNTEELIARGGFGSPTVFVNGDDMYFGNDRIPLIRQALAN